MKGVVFTEFLDMVDAKFGEEMTERILDGAQLASGGAYTAVGTYDYQELIAMVVQLSQASGVPVPDLVRTFGRHLFGRFVLGYPHFFKNVDSTFGFLAGVDGYVHVEVLKLYPDAELPRFTATQVDADTLEFLYQSTRPFQDFAEGLILGCADHFGETVSIERIPVSLHEGLEGTRFLIRRSRG